MQAAFKLKTTVLPGNRIEFSAPELPEGAEVEVFVALPEAVAHKQQGSMLEFLKTLPKSPSPRAFSTWEEYERFLQEEKAAWDR